MRMFASAALLALLVAAGARGLDSAALVATRHLAAARFDLTLPEKVGLLEAGKHRELAFQVSGRLVTLAGEGAKVSTGETVATLDAALEDARRRKILEAIHSVVKKHKAIPTQKEPGNHQRVQEERVTK